jgi:hypothetical protein
VPEILHQASDDQVALAICFGAVVVSGLIMHFSFHVGRLTGGIPLRQTAQPGKFRLHEVTAGHSTITAAPVARERAA